MQRSRRGGQQHAAWRGAARAARAPPPPNNARSSLALPARPPADSLTTPIVQTATYTFVDTAELIAYQEGRYGSYEYGRYGNPTTRACEEKIRDLEGAEDCLVSSSGMNAATTVRRHQAGCPARARGVQQLQLGLLLRALPCQEQHAGAACFSSRLESGSRDARGARLAGWLAGLRLSRLLLPCALPRPQMLLALVPAGGHIVTTTDCYRRTRQFIQTVRGAGLGGGGSAAAPCCLVALLLPADASTAVHCCCRFAGHSIPVEGHMQRGCPLAAVGRRCPPACPPAMASAARLPAPAWGRRCCPRWASAPR